MLYAMGDGNHSFATAKAVWENIKKKAEGNDVDVMQHPARYALVELVNLHDSGLDFEPIHRAVFGIDIEPLMDAAARYFLIRNLPGDIKHKISNLVVKVIELNFAVEEARVGLESVGQILNWLLQRYTVFSRLFD